MALRTLSQEKETILRDRPASVVAGAGSGKTTLLVRAIYDDVEQHGVPLDELFVAAFNRSAAAHLVAKIGDEFACGLQPGRRARDLAGAWVGTFHDLCARIVREQPFAAAVAPDFVVLDDVEALVLQQEALNAAIEDLDTPELADLLVRAELKPIREAVRSIFDRFRSAGEERPALTIGPRSTYDDAPLRAAAQALIEEPSCRDALREAARQALDGSPEELKGHVSATVRPLREAYNAEFALWAKAKADTQLAPALAGFAQLLERFGELYDERKQRQGALDYEDLQLGARRVLQDEAAGKAYRGRFQRVYVDEAQDTNALQQQILAGLAAERTMQVGDEQQSIYRFRWAAVDEFRRLVGFGAGTLRENYRSQEPVLDVLNGWFLRILGAAFLPLEVGAEARPCVERPVELVLVEAENRKPSRRAEAQELARIVQSLHEGEGFAWGEIAVLFRALTAVGAYREELEAAGVPVLLVAGQGFFAHDQVADAIAFLRVIANPRDDEALIRALASPYAAASDEDLALLRTAAGPRNPLWSGVDGVASLAPFAAGVRGLRGRVRSLELPRLVEEALAACDYEIAALGLPEADRRHANLRKLVRLADAHAASGSHDLRAFLGFLDRYVELAVDPGESVVIDEGVNAVRLLSVHAAKGLEYPAVVIADAAHGRPNFTPLILASPGVPSGIKARDDDGELVRAFAYDELATAERASDDEEERRIHYVALTRAMQRLIVLGQTDTTREGRQCPGALQFLADLPGLPSAGGAGDIALGRGVLHVRSVVAAPVEVPESLEPLTVEPAIEAPQPELVTPPAITPGLRGRILSYSALEAHATCSLRFHLERELGVPGVDEHVTGRGVPGLGGRRFGEAFHEVMRGVDWRAPGDDAWAAAAFGELGPGASANDRARAATHYALARNGDVGHLLAAAAMVAVEEPFVLSLDGAVLTGYIDVRAVMADGSMLVVDWKTGRASDGAYALQRELYALACLEGGAPRVELAWVFLDEPHATVREAYSAADRNALAERLIVRLGALFAPPVPAATERQWFCAACPGLRAWCPVSHSTSPP